jgi:hypothetical protein
LREPIGFVLTMALVVAVGQGTTVRVGFRGARRTIAISLVAEVEPRHAKVSSVALDRGVEDPTTLMLSSRSRRAVVMTSAQEGAAGRGVVGGEGIRISPLTRAPVGGIAGLGARVLGGVLGNKVGKAAATGAEALVSDAGSRESKAAEGADATRRRGSGSPQGTLAAKARSPSGAATGETERLRPGRGLASTRVLLGLVGYGLL